MLICSKIACFTIAFLFKSGCKGKDFISYLPNIFGSFFYFFSFFKSSLLRKEEQRKRTVVTARISKRLSNNAALILKAGAKVRTLFHILQINLKFFSFFFLKAAFMKQTAPNNKKKGRGSYSVSVRMSNYRCPRSRKRMQK